MEELGEADNECFSLIDGAAPDEFLVSMSEPNYAEDKLNILDGADVPEKTEAKLFPKKGKYNLRKSLAWDSAFFTSSGVLDAEELSSIIEGSNNNGKQQTLHLPGIQEDVTKSTDSFASLGSDNLTLDSLEADLFCDIRASIQRSGKSSNSRVSDSSGGPDETSSGSQSGSGKKSIEVCRGNAVKLESASKKPSTSLKGDKKMTKSGPVSNQVKKPVARRETPSSLSKLPVARREAPSSLPKLPATTVKRTSMAAAASKVPAAKRMSVSTGRNNVASAMATGCRTSVTKGPLPGDSRSIIPKTASSASVSSATTRAKSSSTRSSHESAASAGSSSETSRIMPRNGLQGKIDRTTSIPSPGIKSKIPSKVLVKGRIQAGNSRFSSSSSTPQISPSVSPASSISEWSSSSSVAAVNQVTNASKDCSDPLVRASLESCTSNEHDSEVFVVPNVSAHKLLGGNGSAANPISSKPSGLRMPSPKIGFFDGAKTVGRNPKAAVDMQSCSGLPRNRTLKSATTGGSSPGGSSSKTRIGHFAGKEATVAAGNFNPDNERINRERNSPSAKLLDGRKHLSESGSGSRKRSGLDKNARPKAISQLEVNKSGSAAKADHPPEICDTPKMLDTHQLPEMANGVEVHNEHHLVSVSQEMGSADHQNAVVVSGGSGATGEKHDEVINGDKGDTELHQACTSQEVGNALRADDEHVGGDLEATSEKQDDVINADQVITELHQACASQEVGDTLRVDDEHVGGDHEAASEKQDDVINGDQANTEPQQACVSQEASESLTADYQNVFGVALSADCGGIEVTCEKYDSTAAMDQQNEESVGKTEDELSEEKNGDSEPDINGGIEVTCEKYDSTAVVTDQQNVESVGKTENELSEEKKGDFEPDINGDKLNTELHQTCVSQELCDTSIADRQDAVAVVVSENNGDVASIEKQNGVIGQDEVNTEHRQACVSEEVGDASRARHENAVAVVVSENNGGVAAIEKQTEVINQDEVNAEHQQAFVSEEVGDALKADHENAVAVVVSGDREATSEKQDDVINVDEVITELRQACVSQAAGDTSRADDEHEAATEKQDVVITEACVSQEVGEASRADDEHVGGDLEATSDKLDDVINGDQVITEIHEACVSQEVGDTSRADDEYGATSEKQDDVIDGDQVIIEPHQACASQEVGDTSRADDENEATSEKQDGVINGEQVSTELHQACVSQDVGGTSRADGEHVDGDREATIEKQDDVINGDQVITELHQASVSQDDVISGDQVITELPQACMSQSRADDEHEATSEKQDDVVNGDQVNAELYQTFVSQEVGNTSRADDEHVDVISGDQVITELQQACVSQEVGDTSPANAEHVGGDHEATSEKQDDLISGDHVITELHQALMSLEVGNTSQADDEQHVGEDLDATSEKQGNVINGDLVIIDLHQACTSQEVGDASSADIEHMSVDCEAASEKHNEVIDGDNTEIHQEAGHTLQTDHENVVAAVLSEESGGSSTTTSENYSLPSVMLDQQSVETEGNDKELSEKLNSPMELPVLDLKSEEEEMPKQTELFVPSRKPVRSTGSDSKKRKPFADKNSLSGECDIEVLVKSFTSLSLGNVQTENC